jgi:hypothetical protein
MFNIYNLAIPMKSKQLALITVRFCPHTVPVPAAVKAEIGEGGSEKPYYRNWKWPQNAVPLLLGLFGKNRTLPSDSLEHCLSCLFTTCDPFLSG